jgi:hypothetical protein
VRSWVFRNRRRLEALLGRPPTPLPRAPVAADPVESPAGGRLPERTPRVVVLQPARRSAR